MTEATEPPFEELERALSGRYSLERRLGRGGMGVVYLARELRLDRLVAIKLLPPDQAASPVARARFLYEARTAAQLSHPHIIPIHAAEQVGGFVFYAMAYVEGETLGQRVSRDGPLCAAEGARLIREVAWALEYAHARGVVHRDVKPDNIMLEAGTGRALVADFGIARVGTGSGTTGPQEVVGTAEFMSPEQARGAEVDPRSDLYSLGALGYYAVAGRLPFNARDPMVVLARHLSEPAPALAEVAPWVPPPLARAIHRCLAKVPEARFQSGQALVEAITQFEHDRAAPPVAVRAFVRESYNLSGLARWCVALAGAGVLPFLLAAPLEPAPPIKLAAIGFGIASLLIPVSFVLRRVRRLLSAGFERDDVVDALEAKWVRRQEELAFVYGRGATRFEWAMRAITYGALGVAGAAVGLGLQRPDLFPERLSLALGAAAAAASLLAAILARSGIEQRTDSRAQRRLRFWRGPLGRWLFRMAGAGMAQTRIPTPPPVLPPDDAMIGVVGDRFFEAFPGRITPPTPA
jgi:eukaryotic-like serine/threonine-protein kinase